MWILLPLAEVDKGGGQAYPQNVDNLLGFFFWNPSLMELHIKLFKKIWFHGLSKTPLQQLYSKKKHQHFIQQIVNKSTNDKFRQEDPGT